MWLLSYQTSVKSTQRLALLLVCQYTHNFFNWRTFFGTAVNAFKSSKAELIHDTWRVFLQVSNRSAYSTSQSASPLTRNEFFSHFEDNGGIYSIEQFGGAVLTKSSPITEDWIVLDSSGTKEIACWCFPHFLQWHNWFTGSAEKQFRTSRVWSSTCSELAITEH